MVSEARVIDAIAGVSHGIVNGIREGHLGRIHIRGVNPQRVISSRIGRRIQIQTLEIRRGFNPKGGGRWRFRLLPRNLPQRLELTVKPAHWRVSGKVVAKPSPPR